MVFEAKEYCWSSYRSKTGLEVSKILDKDECYLGFNNPEKDYRDFVSVGAADDEDRFIRTQLSRNQLTGSDRFVDEVERRVGIRIEAKSPGRPRNGLK